MKKILLLGLLAFGMTACNDNSNRSIMSVPPFPTGDLVTSVEPNFFEICADTVKSGYTAWGRSKVYFGNGENWRDVVKANPILQQPGRVWQDTTTGIWYCMMHPGEVLNPNDTTHLNLVFADTLQKANVPPIPYKEEDGHLWLWALAVLVAFVCGLWWTKKSVQPNTHKDPVTSGVPQVPGGVNDTDAQSRINQIAHNQFGNMANISVHNIRRGRLSGEATVFYADKPNGEKRILNNHIGYAGEITVNGKEETVYFLQGCGNDVRRGNYMTDLTFVADADVPVAPTEPVEQSQQNVVVEKTSTTESKTDTAVVLDIIKSHIEKATDGKSKMTLKFSPDGTIDFGVDYRTYPEKKQKTEEETK